MEFSIRNKTLMFDSISCIPFDFECFILKAAFITTRNDADIGNFLIWRHRDVNLVTWNPIQPMQTEFMWKFPFFYPTHGWDKNFYPKWKPLISLSSLQEYTI